MSKISLSLLATTSVLHIALVSIVLYLVSIISPQLVSILPIVRNTAGRTSHSALVAIAPIENRNYGLFWEPGAFQTYLSLALIVELFLNKTKKVFEIVVLSIALITTFSTAGYFVFAFILLSMFSESMFDRAMHKPMRIICVASLPVFSCFQQVIAAVSS